MGRRQGESRRSESSSSDPSAQRRVIGYVRVSTEHQATDGVSLDAQQARLEAYAVAMDLDLVAIEVDAGLSAKTLQRPGLQSALARLESGEASGLIICKLDRLTRSVKDLGELVDRYFSGRYSLASLADSIDTGSAGGRLVLNVLVSVSQWEREATGERTAEALRHIRDTEGARLGRCGLGERRSTETDEHGRRKVVQDAGEQQALARIDELRALGLTLASIASQLELEGFPTKRGGKWHASTVRSVLLRLQRDRDRRLAQWRAEHRPGPTVAKASAEPHRTEESSGARGAA